MQTGKALGQSSLPKGLNPDEDSSDGRTAPTTGLGGKTGSVLPEPGGNSGDRGRDGVRRALDRILTDLVLQ